MQVRILFFGILKDLIGRSSEALTLPDHATVADVIQHYETQMRSLTGKLSSIAIAVNQQYARPDHELKADDEVALLPPVSGGGAGNPHASDMPTGGAIVREKIDTASVVERIKQPQDGAVVVFEGIVRNHTRDRRTSFLEYEAYEEMALKQVQELAEQAKSQFQIRDVAIVHRLGRLAIGETSVLIVVASAHRAAAFDACRWLIDTLKRTVPIWKKEYFEGGAVWADGEPFPDHIAGTVSRSGASN